MYVCKNYSRSSKNSETDIVFQVEDQKSKNQVTKEALPLARLGYCRPSPQPLSPLILYSPLLLGLRVCGSLIQGLQECDTIDWSLVAQFYPVLYNKLYLLKHEQNINIENCCRKILRFILVYLHKHITLLDVGRHLGRFIIQNIIQNKRQSRR